jgi:hypothetical protein
MTRTLTMLFVGMLAVAVSGCGGSGEAAKSAEPPPSPAAVSEGACKTPEGASAESPPTCAEGCTFDPETVKCVEGTRGIIVDQRNDPKHPGN